MKNQHQNEHREQDEKLGHKSFSGATTTNPDKEKMETVRGNALEESEKQNTSSPLHSNNQPGQSVSSQHDDVDQGNVRIAAFSEEGSYKKGNEDQMKQNDGAQQGNVHEASNKGKNEDSHAGSTLRRGLNSEEVISENDDNVNTRPGSSPSHGGRQEPGAANEE